MGCRSLAQGQSSAQPHERQLIPPGGEVGTCGQDPSERQPAESEGNGEAVRPTGLWAWASVFPAVSLSLIWEGGISHTAAFGLVYTAGSVCSRAALICMWDLK